MIHILPSVLLVTPSTNSALSLMWKPIIKLEKILGFNLLFNYTVFHAWRNPQVMITNVITNRYFIIKFNHINSNRTQRSIVVYYLLQVVISYRVFWIFVRVLLLSSGGFDGVLGFITADDSILFTRTVHFFSFGGCFCSN